MVQAWLVCSVPAQVVVHALEVVNELVEELERVSVAAGELGRVFGQGERVGGCVDALAAERQCLLVLRRVDLHGHLRGWPFLRGVSVLGYRGEALMGDRCDGGSL